MWDFANLAAVHTYNRTSHKSTEYITPLQRFVSNAKCHLNKIRRFGCIALCKNF